MVIGEPTAVERYLCAEGLWAASKDVDLRRLKGALSLGSDVAKAASEITANSGRWIKLTKESARIVQENGLMPSKTEGVSHLMVGVPGSVKAWLQTEQRTGSVLANPAALSGVAAIMAQAATQQAIAEITDYLVSIDEKVTDVLRKQDDAVVAHMIGAGFAIEEAMTVREATGQVNEVTWGKVEGTSETIGYTQGYALLQLKALADKFEDRSKVRDLATVTEEADSEVRQWRAVLARCVQLQAALDVLELDRVLEVSPDGVDDHRRGLQIARQKRLDSISQHTELLLDRIEAAVGTANQKMLWNRSRSPAVVQLGNRIAAGLQDFHEVLGIESVPRSWEQRHLRRAAEIGAQTIQKTKDATPYVAAGVGLVGAAVVGRKVQEQEKA